MYERGGEIKVSDVLTADDKTNIRSILFTMFRAGEVEHKESFQEKVDSDSELKKYVSGLLNNWVRKDKDFNGGEIYKPKAPGSRAGSQDPEIKEMRKLLKVTADENAKVTIQAAIDKKLAEIKTKTNNITIDVNSIPEALRHLLPTAQVTEEA